MPTYFNPFNANPIVPSEGSYKAYTLSSQNNYFDFPETNIPNANGYYLANTMVIGTSTTNQNLVLPDAREVGTGYSFLIFPQGTSSFFVVDNTLAAVATINSTPIVGMMFVLTDNSTQAGSWYTYYLGETTAVAQASALAGNGLTAQSAQNKLWVSNSSSFYSTNTTLTISSAATTVIWNGGNGVITLPAQATGTYPNVVNNGYFVTIKNSSTVNGILTIAPPTGSTIDGQNSLQLLVNESAQLLLNNNLYYSIGTNNSSSTASGAIINANGIQVINGTAGAPSFSYKSNPSLGFYSQTGNDMTFVDGSNQIMELANTPVAGILNGLNLTTGQMYWFGVPIQYFMEYF